MTTILPPQLSKSAHLMFLLLSISSILCSTTALSTTQTRDYTILEVVPHSRTSFTQGLTLSPLTNTLYEGTGLTHQSKILQHDPRNRMETVDTLNVHPGEVFGEGIAWYYVDQVNKESGEINREYRLIQLTWKDGIGMIYKITNNHNQNEDYATNSGKQLPPSSLELIHTFPFTTHTNEGWGITFIPHKNEFYVSDGSEYLFVWDAITLEEKRRMPVLLDRNGSVVRLKYVNELEFVDFDRECGGVVEWDVHEVYLEECRDGDDMEQQQEACGGKEDVDACVEYKNTAIKMNGGFTSTMSILANVWYQDVLIRIDPVTAKVVKVYDLSSIYPHDQRRKDGADCLNGIAVTGSKADEEGLEVWVTGKLWPNMYRIRLID